MEKLNGALCQWSVLFIFYLFSVDIKTEYMFRIYQKKLANYNNNC